MAGEGNQNQSCSDCGDVCMLIGNDCLCQFSTLKFLSLNEYPDLIEQANVYLEGITEECDLCENFGDEENYKYSAIISNRIFKGLYAALIEYYWSCDYGYGQNKPAGRIVKKDDEFSEYEYIKPDYSKLLAKIELYKSSFLKLLKEDCPECFEVEDSLCGCGSNNCNCEETTYSTDTMVF